jgi:hypothetical protein
MIFRLIALLVLGLSSFNTHAQQLYFNLTDGSTQLYTINEVRRIDFDSTNLNLRLTDETVVSIELDALLYYRYQPGTITQVESVNDRPSLNFFPNPADLQLNVRFNFPKTTAPIQLRVHNLKGDKLIDQTLKHANNGEIALDISHFVPGQYICLLTSGDVVISKSFLKL